MKPIQTQKPAIKSPTALYQQLFIPNLGGPSPYLIRLEQLAKKFSKFSKTCIFINLAIGFLLIFSIALKIYYISEYWVHSCEKLVEFYIVTLVSCIFWFVSSYIAIFGIERKSSFLVKIHILILVLASIGFGIAILLWEMSQEDCKLHFYMSFSIIITCIEIGLIYVMIGFALYLYKLMRIVKGTKDQYEREGISFMK